MGVVVRNSMLYADFKNIRNKRIRISLNLTDTKANRAKAEKVLLPKLIQEADDVNYLQPMSTPTFGEILKNSLELHSFERCKQTTKDYWGIANKYLFPEFGHLKIDKIKPSLLMKFQNSCKKNGLSTSRINKLRILISMTFKDAMMDEIIDKNPLSLVKTLPKDRPNDANKDPFSLDEMKILLKSAQGYLRTYIAIGFFTGMRSNEIIALRWSDIDFAQETISIMRGFVKGEVTATKNASSQRVIELPERLVPYLKEQYKLTGKFNNTIFLSKHNTPFHDIKAIRETVWKKLFKDIDVKYRTIYSLRHTFASHMISNGEDITWVSRNLGHSSVQTTLDHYTKLIQKKGKIQRGKFLDALF